MPHCAIVNCKNSSRVVGRANGGISFHRFPTDPHYKEKWINVTGNNQKWFPTKFSTICSIHFDKTSFAGTEKNRRLNKAAYPTIHILKATTNEENIEKPASNEDSPYKIFEIKIENDPTLDEYVPQKPLDIKLEKEPTPNDAPALNTPAEIKLLNKLKAAKQKITQQNLKIKRLREQNRRKVRKILTLVTLLENFKNISFRNTNTDQVESLRKAIEQKDSILGS